MLYEVNQDALRYELEHLGVYKPSVDIMLGKGKITPLKVLQVRTPAANIIKQEMLAAGGDCATPGTTITCAVPHVDILLLGNAKHYKTLVYKLKQMPYFGIPDIVADLETYLAAVPKCTKLADGRLLHYDSVKVMGIINVTPDSFYAGSRKKSVDAVLEQAEQMLVEGAVILDIGGESTRPGSDPVTPEEERQRVLPAVAEIKKRFPESIVSVDTYRAQLAKEALECGGDIINDISAMTADDAMMDVVAEAKAPIILMHRRGTSQERQIGPDKIILDPGIGFAKNDEQNLRLMQNLNALTVNAWPVLLAASRKTTIGNVLGVSQPLPPEERLEGTLAVTAAAVYAGASLVRVHDVKENVRLIRMLEAIRKV